MKKIYDMRLRTKLLSAYSVLFIILFTCGGLIALHLINQTLKTNIENNLSNITRSIINLVETTGQGSIRNYLRAVAEKNLEIAEAIHQEHLKGQYTESESRQKIREILLSQTIGTTGYIYCIDSSGVATVHPNPGVEGNNWAHFPFVHKQTELKTGYIEYHWKNPDEDVERSKALYMIYFEPYDWIISVSTYRDEFKELLPMEQIRHSVKALKFGASGYVFVADSRGNILIHPELEGQNLIELGDKDYQFFEKMVQEGFGRAIYWRQNPGGKDSREKIALYGYIPEYDWIIVSTGYVDELLSFIKVARINTINFIAAALLLSTILTVLLSNSITRRLNHLMSVINQGDKGDLAARAHPGPDDEIGRLARLYNSFLEKLQSYHEKLDAEIKKHRTTAKTLQKSETLFEAVFNQTFQFIGILNPDGTTRKINQTALDFANTKETDMVGMKFWEGPFWNHSETLQNDVKMAVDRASKGEFTRFEVTHESFDGRIHFVDFSLKPIIEKAGKVALLVAEGRDITERKQAEDKIRKSDERLKLALDSVRDAIWDWRIDTGEVYFSSRWFTMLNYEPYELPQAYETWKNLLHPEDLESTELNVFQHAESGKPFELEFRMRTKDNQWRWILARGKTVEQDAGGKSSRMLGTHTDITERKVFNEHMKHVQKMEAIGTLAGGIAHDFNNILSAIIGYIELLQIKLPKNSTELDYANQIHLAGMRAKDLVQQILTFSRQTEQEFKPVQVNIIVKEVIKLLRSSLPTTIEIKQNIQSDYLVIGDPTQIHQILMNLCTNAGHAMQATGGLLSIDLESLKLDTHHVNDQMKLKAGIYIKLKVSDTGHGIPAEHMDRLFDPFFTTKERGEGTGMGLSVVHGIVESYDGKIHVSSEEGKGSTFEIYLPAIESRVVPQIGKAENRPRGSEHILFVDDEPIIVEMGKSQLEILGYSVSSRSDSLEALRLFKSKPDNFDLIITDMTMPKMAGDALAEEIKRIRSDIPIILCTGFSSKLTSENVQQLSIDAVLMKPIILNEMARVVRKTLDRR